jgi:hypothetical protein
MAQTRQPSANYFVFSTPSSTPTTPITTPTTDGKLDLNNRNYVTKDTLCLYTAQGQIICNQRASQLPVAPWGFEPQEKK